MTIVGQYRESHGICDVLGIAVARLGLQKSRSGVRISDSAATQNK
jgi:hypothetical protein